MLRRPQVLALATIVLVAGGVVLVGRHREDIETPAPAVQAPAAPTGQTELERAEEKDKGRDVAPTATGTATATPPPIEAPVTTPPTTRPQRPHQQAKSGGAATVGGKSEPKAQETRREVNQTEGEAQVQEAPVAADAIEQAPTSAQLYARARAAAAAGDCATARSLVAQVQRSDAEYYKAHVASDTSLAACE
jgi:hypothetical protein